MVRDEDVDHIKSEEPQIKVEELVDVKLEEDEDKAGNDDPDDDDESIDSISITDSMIGEDDDTGKVGNGGEPDEIPRPISRGGTTTQSPLRRIQRRTSEIDYKALSGVREYNSNKQMMQLSKKMVRIENPGANHKN